MVVRLLVKLIKIYRKDKLLWIIHAVRGPFSAFGSEVNNLSPKIVPLYKA